SGPFCQPKTHENLKAKAAFRRKRCSQRIQISFRDSNRSKISPRRALRTQRKTIKSLAAVNSVSSVLRFRFSNRSNPSRAVAPASRCLPRTFRRDVFFPPPSFRARTEQCFDLCRVTKPLALDPENEKSHLAFGFFIPEFVELNDFHLLCWKQFEDALDLLSIKPTIDIRVPPRLQRRCFVRSIFFFFHCVEEIERLATLETLHVPMRKRALERVS